MSKFRNFCGDYFGDVENPENFCDKCDTFLSKAVWQVEKCPKSGKSHIQWFFIFRNPVRVRNAKNKIQAVHPGAHVEICHSDIRCNFDYCTKDDTRLAGPFYYPGEWEPRAGQGKRTDLESCITTLRDRGWDAICDEHGSVVAKYHGGLKCLAESFDRRARRGYRDLRVLVLWGAPRTGKTRCAYTLFPELYRLCVLGRSERLWFDGYVGESTLLIDDFYGQIPFMVMLNLLDGHPYRVPIKGGHTYVNYTTVVITSNVHPDRWYENGNVPDECKDALKSRYSRVFEVTKESLLNFMISEKNKD